MKYFLLLVALFSAIHLLAIDPQKEYTLTPHTYGSEYHEIKIETEDLCHLNTWIIEPDKSEEYQGATIVIAGSDAGNMGYSSHLGTELSKKGYRVVMFDYRGFGDSTDFQFDKMHLYHDEYVSDFQSVMKWSYKEYPNEMIGVMALSMGSIISAIASKETSFDFLITEALITSIPKQVQRIKRIKGVTLAVPLSSDYHAQRLRQLQTPFLAFVGNADDITTSADHRELGTDLPQLEIITYEGGHLKGILSLGIDTYLEYIDLFVQAATRSSRI